MNSVYYLRYHFLASDYADAASRYAKRVLVSLVFLADGFNRDQYQLNAHQQMKSSSDTVLQSSVLFGPLQMHLSALIPENKDSRSDDQIAISFMNVNINSILENGSD